MIFVDHIFKQMKRRSSYPSIHRFVTEHNKLITGAVLASLLILATTARASAFSISQTSLYDPPPDHPWNNLYRTLLIRTAPDGQEYGYDELDPPLWRNTRYLLNGASHKQAVTELDQFLTQGAESLIQEPLKRAMLQRDLWPVFDWSVQAEGADPAKQRALQDRLARVIQRLALPATQIKTLPDNLAEAVRSGSASLPQDLMDSNGSWVLLGRANSAEPLALQHATSLSDRSVYLIFLRLPEGRKATLNYLSHLKVFPKPFITIPDGIGGELRLPAPNLPQFPVGTQVALVRQALLIDNKGRLIPSTITESVQIRTYRVIGDGTQPSGNQQDVFEWRLRRRDLFAGQRGGLYAVGPTDKEIHLFGSHGLDLIESSMGPIQQPILNSCMVCHGPANFTSTRFARGIETVLIYTNAIRSVRPEPQLIEARRDTQAFHAIQWKRRQNSWMELQKYFQRQTFHGERKLIDSLTFEKLFRQLRLNFNGRGTKTSQTDD